MRLGNGETDDALHIMYLNLRMQDAMQRHDLVSAVPENGADLDALRPRVEEALEPSMGRLPFSRLSLECQSILKLNPLIIYAV